MRRQPSPYVGPTVLGIDVSRYQGHVRWGDVAGNEPVIGKAKQGRVKFAVCRAGVGLKPDPTCVRNLDEASSAGLHVAVYHAIRGAESGVAQADMVLEAVRMSGARVGWIAIDVEGRPDDGRTSPNESSLAWAGSVSTERVLDSCGAFALTCRSAGYRVILYTGQSWHWFVSQRGDLVSRRPWIVDTDLWVPWYGLKAKSPRIPVGPEGEPAPWSEWQIWQYAGTPQGARISGIDGPVDLNRFRGDLSSLALYWSHREGPTRAREAADPLEDARDELYRRALLAKAQGHDEAAARLIEFAATIKP